MTRDQLGEVLEEQSRWSSEKPTKPDRDRTKKKQKNSIARSGQNKNSSVEDHGTQAKKNQSVMHKKTLIFLKGRTNMYKASA